MWIMNQRKYILNHTHSDFFIVGTGANLFLYWIIIHKEIIHKETGYTSHRKQLPNNIPVNLSTKAKQTIGTQKLF